MSDANPIHAAIRATIDADSDATPISTLATGGIYGEELPKDVDSPAVRYVVISESVVRRSGHGNTTDAMVQFDVFSDRGSESVAYTIDGAIKRLFDNVDITVSSKSARMWRVNAGSPIREPSYYRLRSLYRVQITGSSS